MKKIIWMFSGQGSQFYQMGRDLYETEPVFREALERGDRFAAPLLNESLIDVIYRPRENRFEPFLEIVRTHPAIFLVEYALAQLLLARGLRPDYLLGYSLGEYTALVLAGSISFEEALLTLIKQAQLLEYAAPRGGMAAILDSPDLVGRSPELFAGCEIAGTNFPKSFIVSAPAPVLAERLRQLKAHGVSAMELPVSYPFHSRWMEAIRTPSQAILARLDPKPLQIPVLSATTGRRLETCTPAHLWEATRNRVDFAGTIRNLEAQGNFLYVDLGPSGGMATAVKYNLAAGSGSAFLSVITPYGQEGKHLARVLEASAAVGVGS